MRTLKSKDKNDKEAIGQAVSELLALKEQYKELTGEDPPQTGGKKAPKQSAKDKASSQKFQLKNPKGMRDYFAQQMTIREQVYMLLRLSETVVGHGDS